MEKFGLHTSGQVALYDPAGRLLFGGGITAGADTRATTPPKRRCEPAFAARPPSHCAMPVFGCSVRDS